MLSINPTNPEIRTMNHDLKLVGQAQTAPLPAGKMPLKAERIARAKHAYSTRRVPSNSMRLLLADLTQRPHAGDLVLAEVTGRGQHARIELPCGRRSRMFVGDEIIVCYANRYAPDQFEAVVPDDLGACALVAGGGIAARMQSKRSGIKRATPIRPLGLIADSNGRRLNIKDWALPSATVTGKPPYTIAVVGTSMNAGKTTAAAKLIRGLVLSGLKVGAAKVTGTGAGCDSWFFTDAGADPVVDFTDAGLASTWGAGSKQHCRVLKCLGDHIHASGVDVTVLEIADGLLFDDTAQLLMSPAFGARVHGIVFAAGDAMGATAGVDWLRRRGFDVVAVAGRVTASPLAIAETKRATGLPVLGSAELARAGVMQRLADQLPALVNAAPLLAAEA